MDPDARARAAIEEHWKASERGDVEAEHAIYAATSPSSGSLAAGTCG
jgi:hypothetical protein